MGSTEQFNCGGGFGGGVQLNKLNYILQTTTVSV